LGEREFFFFFFLGIWVKWKKVPSSIFLSDFDEERLARLINNEIKEENTHHSSENKRDEIIEFLNASRGTRIVLQTQRRVLRSHKTRRNRGNE
jgi:hypothetical protein